jgi:hypothetical protein
MMKRVGLFFILIWSCLIVSGQKNLVADGDFKTGTEKLNGKITNPGNLVWYGQTSEVASGDGFQTELIDLGYNQRVMHASFANVNNRSTYLCQNITYFEPNKRYKIGFWLKMNLPGCALRVELRAHDWENGKIIYNKKMLGSIEINPDKKNVSPETWQYYSFTVNTQDIDEELLGSKYVRLLFFFNQSFASGKPVFHNPETGQYKYWLTDVSAKELPDMISNNNFERWDMNAEPAELSGWETENADPAVTKGWKESDRAVRLTAKEKGNGMLISSPIEVSKKTKYTITFWARSSMKGTKLTTYVKGDLKKRQSKLDAKWTLQRFVFDKSEKDSNDPLRLIFELNEGKQAEIDNITIE